MRNKLPALLTTIVFVCLTSAQCLSGGATQYVYYDSNGGLSWNQVGTVSGYADLIIWNLKRGKPAYLSKGTDDKYKEYVKIKFNKKKKCGFRLGLRFNPACYSGDLNVEYTFYHPKFDKGNKTLKDSYFLALYPNEVLSNMEPEFKLYYDVLDLTFGSTKDTECDETLRPFLGFRYARIKQRFITKYDFVDRVSLKIKKSNVINAPGLRFGVDFTKQLCCIGQPLQFYGRIAFGAYVGNQKLSIRGTDVTSTNAKDSNAESDPSTEDDESTGSKNICRSSGEGKKEDIWKHSESCYQTLKTLEVAIGAKTCIYNGRNLSIDLGIGYEIHHWDNVSDFIEYSNCNPNPNFSALGLNGLVIRLGGTYYP